MAQLLEAERKARHETEMRLKAMQDWVGAGRGVAAQGSCTSCASLQERLASAELERELAVAEARHGLALASIADANGSNDSAVGNRPTLSPNLESRVAELEAQLEAQDAVSQTVQDELRGQLESLNASSSQNAEKAAALQAIMIQMRTSLATSEERVQEMSHVIAVAEEANAVLRARAEVRLASLSSDDAMTSFPGHLYRRHPPPIEMFRDGDGMEHPSCCSCRWCCPCRLCS
jgi:hypothetical protein